MLALQNALKNHPNFVCGKTIEETAQAIYEDSQTSQTGQVYECDFTAFDSSQSTEILQILYDKCYRKLFGHAPELYKALNAQLQSKCTITDNFGRRITSFTKRGGRCSGDTDTYIGNTILNYILHRCFAKTKSLVGRFSGDDSVVFDYNADVADFASLGFAAKIRRSSSVWDATFCSSLVYPTARGFTLLRNPNKSIVRHCYSPYYLSPKVARIRYKEKLTAEAYANNGIPVLGCLFYTLATKHGFRLPQPTNRESRDLLIRCNGKFTYLQPTQDARELFEKHFGIPLDLQQEIENKIRRSPRTAFDMSPIWEHIISMSALYF
ncbi:hypothetical protein 2 [Beihai tombus-like virus 16]|uniref:hypothetical protein 2 n=1 Tax=Beihai tombus-like virus 16 TaxID=1922719 RepID=UPI00090B6BBE|nr:hypothetical protein 2 [Beihai tombus-like virus 16]APG76151.1 hypothetical protein 2 [Beihai tombus-like virus 16]